MMSASLPALLLLPGMMLDQRVYAAQVAALSSFTSVAIGDITCGDSIEEMAANVLASAPPRFALAGLSMGAIVAFEMWRQARRRITHFGVMDSTPYADKPERKQVRFEQIAAVESGKLRDVLVHSMKPLYLAQRNRGDIALLESILAMGLELGPEVFRRQSIALRDRRDVTELLPTIACPSLVLCGREDALCPMEFHETMARAMPRTDLIVLAECGHLSAIEEPAAVTFALRRLIERPE